MTETDERKPERGARPTRRGSRRLLGVRVDVADYLEAAHAIFAMADAGGGMTCVANVHMVMEAWDAPDFRALVNDAELVTSDGVPLVWALRALGVRRATRVYGPTLMPFLCEQAARRGIPVGFYGGSPAVMDELTHRLAQRYSRLAIAFAHSPPYSDAAPAVDEEIVSAIEESGARVLFVGLGCPKQERWMAAHREHLSCALVGVGAAFDFVAGAKAQAPAWLQRAGLEWLFRLASEPRRLWWRYAWHNPRFALRMALQVARERVTASSSGAEAPIRRS
jgi:N-acetylglucosaminyldiphosphoundecaprenol N-acetyl-beta-D-mannosaminyltransferase